MQGHTRITSCTAKIFIILRFNRSSLRSNLRSPAARVVLSWCAILLVLGTYWFHLEQSHEIQLQQAKEQTLLRATQTAHALALQTRTLIDQVEYIAHHMGEHWLRDGKTDFRRVIATAQNTLPDGALIQVAIADKHGNVVFSNLVADNESASRVSIADREHFKVHSQRQTPQLFISHPLFGRVSQKWAVQFSLPIFDKNQFAGVTVISISPEYLSRALQDLFPDPANVALLLRDDGAYIARSHDLEKVLGKVVPDNRIFLQNPALQYGSYEATSFVDGVPRYYAWHRTPDAPLILSLGLSEEKALAPVRASIRESLLQNALGTALLLLAAAWITQLYLKNRQQTDVLRNTSEQLALVLRGSELGTWDLNLAMDKLQFNKRWASMLGYQEPQLPLTRSGWERLLHPDDLDRVQAAFDRHLRGEAPLFEAEYRVRHHDGHWIWLMDRGQVVRRGLDGQALRMAGAVLDITARKHAEVAEAEYHERMATLLQRFPGGVLMEDANDVVVMANQLFCNLFGLPDAPASLSGLSHAQLQTRLGEARKDWLHCPDGGEGEQRKTVEVAAPGGQALEIDWVPIAHDKNYLGRVWLVRDISQRKQQEALLTAQAKTDALTGLPNRHSFMPYLESMIRNNCAAGRDSGALLMLDLDHFKRVNDTYGHPVGDVVLQHTARVIKECLRDTDTAGRLGGEEFAILLSRTNLANAQAMANRLREKLARTPAPTEKGDIPITISIGLTMLAGASAKQALSCADEALYSAKAAGRNRVQVWTAHEAQRLREEPLEEQ